MVHSGGTLLYTPMVLYYTLQWYFIIHSNGTLLYTPMVLYCTLQWYFIVHVNCTLLYNSMVLYCTLQWFFIVHSDVNSLCILINMYTIRFFFTDFILQECPFKQLQWWHNAGSYYIYTHTYTFHIHICSFSTLDQHRLKIILRF